MASFLVKLAGVTAAGVGGTYYLAQQQDSVQARPALAPPSQDANSRRSALPIYDLPQAPSQLTLVKSPLQDQVGEARHLLADAYDVARTNVRKGAVHWIGLEQDAESKLKGLVASDENLTPGGLYVAIATMAGSIVAKNRNVLLRILLPVTFFATSLAHFLPHTAENMIAAGMRLNRSQASDLPTLRQRSLTQLRREQSR